MFSNNVNIKLVLAICTTLFFAPVNSQNSKEKWTTDTTSVNDLIRKSEYYFFQQFNADSSMYYADKAEERSREIKFTAGLVKSLNTKSGIYRAIGDFPMALETLLEVRGMLSEERPSPDLLLTLIQIGATFTDLTDHEQALRYLLEAKEMYDKSPFTQFRSFLLTRLGNAYEKLDKLDSSMWYQRQAWSSISPDNESFLGSIILQRLGVIHFRSKNYDSARYYYYRALDMNDTTKSADLKMYVYISLARLYDQTGIQDSVFYFARLALSDGLRQSEKQIVLEASQLLSEKYRDAGRMDSAFHYLNLSAGTKDSLYGLEKLRKVQLLVLQQLQEQQKKEQQQQVFRSRTRMFILISTVLVFLTIALILFFNNRQKKRANTLLAQQKEQVEGTLAELKAAQAQLIQSEKMASLGELTAGIAHEIQNPLNFVNNFSDVNKELVDELKSELATGNMQLATEIADDIKTNEEKINHHGKRADAIVKGMLQHSRIGSGQKEPTDINALCDEYLRLAYHGLKAKDKSFNAKFVISFDEAVGKINVVPQDIGRVVLNLINNAFYAVNERAKQNIPGYEPIVIVSTKKDKDKIEIKVKDNGSGIPEKILEKIFQPFFTTKPTGEGTGLGLSLAYDIITKGHSGKLKVETKEGEGSEFIIRLPVN